MDNNFIPKEYLEKRAFFLNMELYVDNRVYIPNPETEWLVLLAIQYIKDNNLSKGIFVDVGTGSGNIAISIAKHFPESTVIATDISEAALEVAAINLRRHEINNVCLVHTNYVEAIMVQPDLVVANLPWGNEHCMLNSTKPEYLPFMPPIALFPPNHAFGSYEKLSEMIEEKKWTSKVIVETGAMPQSIIQPSKSWKYQKFDSLNYSVASIL